MAEQKRDYYEVLGISKTADDAEIKKAYRVLAKKYHPDMNPGDAEAEKKFKEASEAYAVLSDPEKRRQYDQFGHAAFEGGGAGGFGGFDFNSADFGDIFGDIFGDFFGGGRRRGANNGPMKGANIRTSVRITFEEAVFGVSKEIELTLKDECATCHGTGAKPGTSPETCTKCGGKGQVVFTQQSFFGTVRNVQSCPECNGTGKVIKEKCADCHGTGYIANRKKIQVSIPAGIDNGQSVRIRDKGEPGTNGQHSFYQLLHQGTDIVPLQFVGFKNSQIGTDVVIQDSTSQQKLCANVAAQIVAFACGKEDENRNKNFEGGRPSSIIIGDQLTPASLGALLAHFENKIMFQGFLWNVNSFDQEGVQLGKVLAKRVLAHETDGALKVFSDLLNI